MKLRGRRGQVAATAVTGLLLLTGCGQLDPGAAADVNGTRISDQQVTDLAEAQCTAADRAAKGGQSTTMAVSRVRAQSLGLLMDTELSLQYGKEKGIKPQKGLVDGFFNQLEQGIDPLPEKARTVLTDVFTKWAEGRAILVEAGSEATGQQVSFTNVDQLVAAGLKERDGFLREAEITTDPRYSPNKQGFPGGGDGSVSRPGSDFAKSAGAAQPDPEWVSGLPENQKCG